MALFAPAFDYLMSHEDPGLTGTVTEDSSGVTRWGISQKAYPCLDIRNLSLEDAACLYRNDYFKAICGYDIADQRVASKLFDMAANMGQSAAVRLVQRIVGITADGKFGLTTLAAVNQSEPLSLLGKLVEHSVSRYYAVVAANPQEEVDLEGWLKRARELPPEIAGATA